MRIISVNRSTDTKRVSHPFALRSLDVLTLPAILSGGKDTNYFPYYNGLWEKLSLFRRIPNKQNTRKQPKIKLIETKSVVGFTTDHTPYNLPIVICAINI